MMAPFAARAGQLGIRIVGFRKFGTGVSVTRRDADAWNCAMTLRGGRDRAARHSRGRDVGRHLGLITGSIKALVALNGSVKSVDAASRNSQTLHIRLQEKSVRMETKHA